MSVRRISILRLTWANLRYRPLTAIFNILLLAMGIAIILTLTHLNEQLDNRLQRDLRGIDLVVSGKGSPLQIILSTVFHLDVPTGNISLEEAETLEKNPLVAQAIPLALGDNLQGYRIVGTTQAYIDHYSGTLSQGRIYAQAMEAVVGSEVAKTQNLKLGETIIGAHGLVNSDDLHVTFPYTITGILNHSGTVLDRLVLTPVESVWHVHELPDPDDLAQVLYKRNHPGKELTALLISYRSPLAAAQLPRLVNESSAMQAASPAFEITRLAALLGTGRELLSAFGIMLVGFAAFGFFVTLYNAINERRYDIALMRSLGATRKRIMGFIMLEALGLGLGGAILGIVVAQLFLKIVSVWVASTKHVELAPIGFGWLEVNLILAALGLSVAAAIIPAVKAYKVNIVQELARS